MTPVAMDAVSTQQQLPSPIPHPDGSCPAAVPQPDCAAPSLLAPPCLINPEASSPQLTEAAQLQPQLDRPTAAPAPPDTQAQHQLQTRTPEPLPPAAAPHSPLGSAAVWKKNQGEGLLTLKKRTFYCSLCTQLLYRSQSICSLCIEISTESNQLPRLRVTAMLAAL